MNGSLGNQSAVFPFFFRGWLSKMPNFLLVRPLKLVFCVLFLLPFFINEGFNNELFLRFEIFVERVWQRRVSPSSSLTLLPVSTLCRVREPHAPPWQLNTVECWTQRTILSRLPLHFSLFDSFRPSQCGFYQKLKDYCRIFPQINNESIAKPSSRFVDSNGPHTTLCYHSAKGHFAASQYSWIFGKRKFIELMSGKFIWTACSAHMQIISIPGGMMLFHLYTECTILFLHSLHWITSMH